MVPVISYLTMKGGVGKTTLAANLTRSLADLKPRRILLIDADAQCNLSQVFFESEDIESANNRSIYDAFDTKGRALYAGDIKRTIFPTREKQLLSGSAIDFIIGSFDTFELSATANNARRAAAAQRFKDFIDQAKKEYDLIAIDTNPSATFVTMQALANSNFLVAPVTFDAFSLQGINLVISHLKATYQWLENPDRICLIANKVPRNPSDSEFKRLEKEEEKIRQRFPRLARSIMLERIHSSSLIANRPVAKGFIADHNGCADGYYAAVVQDFDEAAKAVNLSIENVFTPSKTKKSETSIGDGWATFKEWIGGSISRN